MNPISHSLSWFAKDSRALADHGQFLDPSCELPHRALASQEDDLRDEPRDAEVSRKLQHVYLQVFSESLL